MSLKTKSKRLGALLLALVFFATSVGFSVMVIMQIKQDKSGSDPQAELQKALNQQTKENSLEGKPLDNFTPVNKVESLQKIDLKEGNGEEVKPGASVTAHYTGALAGTGLIFQSSLDRGEPIPFSLDGVIKGWTEGVPGMKVGGKRRLLIPASLAYGEAGSPPTIPPNADLVFDIELVAVQNP